jgi:hypothetical protein
MTCSLPRGAGLASPAFLGGNSRGFTILLYFFLPSFYFHLPCFFHLLYLCFSFSCLHSSLSLFLILFTTFLYFISDLLSPLSTFFTNVFCVFQFSFSLSCLFLSFPLCSSLSCFVSFYIAAFHSLLNFMIVSLPKV